MSKTARDAALPPPPKSTNVRVSWAERSLRAAFGSLGPWAPSTAARLAERVFCTAPRGRSARVDAALSTGERRDLGRGRERIATWRWGQGPRVVLIHGWGGRAGQLAELVSPLVAAGHEVVAIDAPGHGASGGRLSSMVDFARALISVEADLGRLHGVVGHSLGGAAIALALAQGLQARRVVFIGAPAGPADWTREFAERLRISDPIMRRVRQRIEERLQMVWADLDVIAIARHQGAPLLVVHDRGDLEVPFTDGQAIAEAWPGARLLPTEGLGHRRILRDPTVVEEVVSFLAPSGGPGLDATRPRGEARADAATALEQELFFRALRWPPAPALTTPVRTSL